MKKSNSGNIYYIMFLLLIVAAVVCGGLVSKGILPTPFWFLSVLLIAFASAVYNKRNYNEAKTETDKRREARALRKNQSNHRYL